MIVFYFIIKTKHKKKQLIGALVGGLILFIWQFITFGPGNLHYSQMQHLPQQDAILQALADIF